MQARWQPWFLYLAWFAPHVPLESPEPWFSRIPKQLPFERRQALAMIAAMDDGLGRIREKLRTMGVEKNTLIFFIGDNGAPLKNGAWDGSLNLPLIGEKGMPTDGGVRTPFVAAWPDTLPAGTVYEHPVISLDVAATAVALAGLPHDPKLDGVNLMPFLTGGNKAAPHETLYWRWRTQAAVLEFPWKFIRLGDKERYPIALQGGYNRKAKWHGTWTANYNAEQTFWPAFSSNHPELAEPFIDLANAFHPRARWYAKTVFGCDGAVTPHNLWPFEPDPADCKSVNQRQLAFMPWSYGMGTAGHIASIPWLHYAYTGDKAYLKDKVYPVLKDYALFYASYAETCKAVDGKVAFDKAEPVKTEHTPPHRPAPGNHHWLDLWRRATCA